MIVEPDRESNLRTILVGFLQHRFGFLNADEVQALADQEGDCVALLNDTMIPAMRDIGERFSEIIELVDELERERTVPPSKQDQPIDGYGNQ